MKIHTLLSAFAAILSLTFSACSPYASHIKRLDADYRAGRIPTKDYYSLRSQLMEGDNQWRANHIASMNTVTANMNQANAVNAYNARTQVYAQPQQVNVNHSGSINHNVNGSVNVYGY